MDGWVTGPWRKGIGRNVSGTREVSAVPRKDRSERMFGEDDWKGWIMMIIIRTLEFTNSALLVR